MEFAIQKSIQIEKADILKNMGFVSEKLVLVKLSNESEKLRKLKILNAAIYVNDDIPFKEFIKSHTNGKWSDKFLILDASSQETKNWLKFNA